MLHQIAETFNQKKEEVDLFFSEQSEGLIPPIYLSCDIRHSGKKVGVIDTNLFPAGFNNLCNAYSRRATAAFRKYFNRHYPTVQNIIVLSEEHTRNRYYLENILRLQELLASTGLNCRVAYCGETIQEETLELPLNDNRSLRMEKLKVEGGEPVLEGFKGDLILSNNDFSKGIPEILKPILNKIIPHPNLGWHQRRKSDHFKILKDLINDLSQRIGLDPWLLYGIYNSLSVQDLSQEQEIKSLSNKVEETLGEIQSKYKEHQITDTPYVFVKNDSGTYGMGLLDVNGPDEILNLNRRQRNKLLSNKGGRSTEAFLIQEGIPTADFYSNLPIEPVIYMIGFEPVGGFFRMNTERDALSSLNAPGMVFSCLCLHTLDEPHEDQFLNCAEKENLVSLSNVLARMASLAAAKEMMALKAD